MNTIGVSTAIISSPRLPIIRTMTTVNTHHCATADGSGPAVFACRAVVTFGSDRLGRHECVPCPVIARKTSSSDGRRKRDVGQLDCRRHRVAAVPRPACWHRRGRGLTADRFRSGTRRAPPADTNSARASAARGTSAGVHRHHLAVPPPVLPSVRRGALGDDGAVVDDDDVVGEYVGLLEVLRGEQYRDVLFGSAEIRLHTPWRLRGSSPVVGSSRNTTSGRTTSPQARSTRRRMPPE